MTVDMTEVRQLFFEESFESLDAMESNLLDLGVGTVDREFINSIFRAAHSIKGGAGIFKFDEVVAFAHTTETFLDEMREGQHIVTQAIIDVLLRSVDIMRMMLSALKEDREYEIQQVIDCQNALCRFLKTPLEELPIEPIKPKEPLSPELMSPLVTTPTVESWHIVFKPYPPMLKTGNDPINLFRELSHLGQLQVTANVSQLPNFTEIDPQLCYFSWNLTLHTEAPKTAITEIFEWVEGDCELEIIPLSEWSELTPSVSLPTEATLPVSVETEVTQEDSIESSGFPVAEEPLIVEESVPLESVAIEPESSESVATATLETTSPELVKATPEPVVPKGGKTLKEILAETEAIHTRNSAGGQVTEASSVRVSIDKIDALINIVGELVITQSMLDQVREQFDDSKIGQLQDGLAQLERNTRELQESVMRIRMLPINFSFNRFPRLVHDLSVQLDKKVELKLTGENTELDKTVLEKINDPLVHLVRNALDHGIELPAQRRALGKSEKGLLHLHAFHQGTNIVIQVSDDGAGFDMEKVRVKATAQGFLTPNETATEEQLYEIIFQPGFSTATHVSDLSGRGVGMDVVRRNIRSLGGSIEIKSKPGQGTTFSIRLPLTLAILDGQLVRVGNEIYILSLLSILESLRADPHLVNAIAGKAEIYKLRNEYIPILRLYELFDIVPGAVQLEQGLLVIVEGDGQRIGLFVDELLSQQQIVVKNLDTNYKQVKGVSGATILGDGSVALILDVPGLIRLFQSRVPKISGLKLKQNTATLIHSI